MPGNDSLAFYFMRYDIKKIIGVNLVMIFSIGLFWKISEAVVPPSVSTGSEAKTERQKLADILQKIEHREEENVNFLKDLINEMRNLK